MTANDQTTILFFDDFHLYHRENLDRKVGRPRLIGRFEDPHLEVPWGYPSVFRDPITGRWRCVYQGTIRRDQGRDSNSQTPDQRFVPVICESDDGINWQVPDLSDLVDLSGRLTPHQILPLAGFGEWSPAFHDDRAENPAERLKGLLSLLRASGGPAERAPLYVSPDGVRWHRATGKSWHPVGIDPIGYPFWNPLRETYVFTARPSPGDRRIAVYETSDWRSFSKPEVALQADALDSPVALHYGMPVLPYEGYFVGFLWVFHTDPNAATSAPLSDVARFSAAVATRDHKGYLGRIDCQLTHSSNGWHFQRGLRDPFMPNADPGEDGAGQIYPSSFLRTDDAIRIYSSSARYEHGQAEDSAGGSESTLLVHELRLDGFVFLESVGGWGGIHTRTLFCNGPDLSLNVLAPQGEVRVQVTDEFGAPLEGYAFDDSVPFTGDSLSWRPQWRDGVNFGMLGERLIRVGVRLLNGRVHAIRGSFHPVGPLDSRSYTSTGRHPPPLSSYAQ
jgi:hypothetical protein